SRRHCERQRSNPDLAVAAIPKSGSLRLARDDDKVGSTSTDPPLSSHDRRRGRPPMKLRLLAAAMALALAAPAFVAPAFADDAAGHPAYWGSPSVDGGKCCATLAEVRDNIDRIDREIVALMAERGKYVA